MTVLPGFLLWYRGRVWWFVYEPWEICNPSPHVRNVWTTQRTPISLAAIRTLHCQRLGQS